MPDPAFPFTLPFLVAKDVGDGPGLGRGRATPDQDDDENEYGTLPDGTPGHKPGTPQNPYVGGDPSQGRYAMASDPGAPPEPPMSPSGHNWYTDEEMEAWDAAGRPSNHDYLKQRPGTGTGC